MSQPHLSDPSSLGGNPEVYGRLVSHATLAPSSHNTQPWLFRIGGDSLAVLADRTRALPVNDPDDRELTISCGAALMNARLVAAAYGRPASVERFPDPEDPDLLARIRLGQEAPCSDEERELFEAIPIRRTHRKRFAEREPPSATMRALERAARDEGAWLHVVREQSERLTLAHLVAEGDRMLWADRRWRRELGAWMHPRRKGDGLAVSPVAGAVVPFIVTNFDMGKGQAAKDRELAEGSPVLVSLGTDGDGPGDWLAAGQALERVLLRAATEGLQGSYLNQPNQVAELRPRLQHLLGTPGFPQIVLRLGYPEEEVPATPRRPVAEVTARDDRGDG